MACFALVLLLVADRREHPSRLWLVPVIVAIWANLHGSFFLGPLVVGLAWLQDVARQGRTTPPDPGRRPRQCRGRLPDPIRADGLGLRRRALDEPRRDRADHRVAGHDPARCDGRHLLRFGRGGRRADRALRQGRSVADPALAWRLRRRSGCTRSAARPGGRWPPSPALAGGLITGPASATETAPARPARHARCSAD